MCILNVVCFYYVDTLLSAICYSLSNLESLELRENVLKYLPSSFAFLVKLKRLDLGANMFDELVGTSLCSVDISIMFIMISFVL